MGDMWVTECLAALQSSVVRLCVRLSRNKGNAARIVCSILPLVLLYIIVAFETSLASPFSKGLSSMKR